MLRRDVQEDDVAPMPPSGCLTVVGSLSQLSTSTHDHTPRIWLDALNLHGTEGRCRDNTCCTKRTRFGNLKGALRGITLVSIHIYPEGKGKLRRQREKGLDTKAGA
jgi:hypothetical protein